MRKTVRDSILLTSVLLLTGALAACSGSHAGVPLAFTEADVPREPEPSTNWSIPPERAEEVLRNSTYEIRSVIGAGAGVTGARKVDIMFETTEADEEEVYLWEISGDVELKAKPFPSPSLDGWNNNPRKEITAYEVQKLFLDPRDYVVPTTLARCVPLEINRQFRDNVQSTIGGTNCVLMVLSLWLENVTVPDEFYDEARFASDPAYAYAYGVFNILTYLSDHRDNRKGNFLVSKDDQYPRAYAIDNGIAFGSWIYNWFIPSSHAWKNIVVPAVPKSAVDRLRELSRADLDRFSVVAEFRMDAQGYLEAVSPGESVDPTRAVNIHESTVQLGLTENEIDDLWERIEDLIERVDEGKLGVF